MASRKMEKRQYKLTNAAKVASEQATFTRTTFKVPTGMSLFTPKKGQDYEIDIIPYQLGKRSKRFNKALCGHFGDPGDWHYERTYFAHAKVGINEEWLVCPKCTFSNPCVGCDHTANLRKQDPNNRDAISAVKAKRRQIFLVFDRNDQKKGLQLWENASFNFGENLNFKINTARPENKRKWENFHDPNGGFTMRIVSAEKSVGGTKTNTVWMVDEFIERKGGIPDDLMDLSVCLDDLITEVSSQEFEKAYTGQKDSDDENDAPTKERPKRGVTEEIDEDEDEDEEEDEEEKPARSSRKTIEPDDDDDDDEEEDTPVLRKRKLRNPRKGMEVSFTYRGKRKSGVIKKIDEAQGIAMVDCGDERPSSVDLSDLEQPDEVEDDPNDDDETPKGRTTSRSSRKVVEPDDDNDDDEDDDEDEKPTRRSSRATVDADDDEEEPLEDEEEEEEKPVRRGRPPRR